MVKMKNVKVRLVGEEDIPAMTANRLAYLTEMQGERSPEYMQNLEKELTEYFRAHIQSGSFFALVAESEGLILGYGAMVLRSIPGDLNKSSYLEGDILNMYTLPFARKRGVGKLILEALLNRARTLGLSKVALHTSKDGEHLYRSFGFSEPVYPYLELVL
jgi:GNAT superfamily N-acetyltransferase